MEYQMNPTLFDIAAWRLRDYEEKQAFIPAGGGGDPSMGGAMPPDAGGQMPADPAAGGMPPGMGAMPPGDPAAAAAPPPGGGMPAPAPGLPPEMMAAITQAVQQAMAGGGTGATPGAAGPGKSAKIDPGMIYMELGRVRKLLTTMFQHIGIPLPPDILDDQAVAASVAGAQPASQPIGQEGMPAAPGAPPGGGGLPAIGQSPAVPPIEQKTAHVSEFFETNAFNIGREYAAQAVNCSTINAKAALMRSLARQGR